MKFIEKKNINWYFFNKILAADSFILPVFCEEFNINDNLESSFFYMLFYNNFWHCSLPANLVSIYFKICSQSKIITGLLYDDLKEQNHSIYNEIKADLFAITNDNYLGDASIFTSINLTSSGFQTFPNSKYLDFEKFINKYSKSAKSKVQSSSVRFYLDFLKIVFEFIQNKHIDTQKFSNDYAKLLKWKTPVKDFLSYIDKIQKNLGNKKTPYNILFVHRYNSSKSDPVPYVYWQNDFDDLFADFCKSGSSLDKYPANKKRNASEFFRKVNHKLKKKTEMIFFMFHGNNSKMDFNLWENGIEELIDEKDFVQNLDFSKSKTKALILFACKSGTTIPDFKVFTIGTKLEAYGSQFSPFMWCYVRLFERDKKLQSCFKTSKCFASMFSLYANKITSKP